MTVVKCGPRGGVVVKLMSKGRAEYQHVATLAEARRLAKTWLLRAGWRRAIILRLAEVYRQS